MHLNFTCSQFSNDADNPSPAGPKAPKKASRPSGFGSWMLGSSKQRGRPAGKDNKRPDVTAGYQHTAGHDQNPCSVM
jgi:hypothetical protein